MGALELLRIDYIPSLIVGGLVLLLLNVMIFRAACNLWGYDEPSVGEAARIVVATVILGVIADRGLCTALGPAAWVAWGPAVRVAINAALTVVCYALLSGVGIRTGLQIYLAQLLVSVPLGFGIYLAVTSLGPILRPEVMSRRQQRIMNYVLIGIAVVPVLVAVLAALVRWWLRRKEVPAPIGARPIHNLMEPRSILQASASEEAPPQADRLDSVQSVEGRPAPEPAARPRRARRFGRSRSSEGRPAPEPAARPRRAGWLGGSRSKEPPAGGATEEVERLHAQVAALTQLLIARGVFTAEELARLIAIGEAGGELPPIPPSSSWYAVPPHSIGAPPSWSGGPPPPSAPLPPWYGGPSHPGGASPPWPT